MPFLLGIPVYLTSTSIKSEHNIWPSQVYVPHTQAHKHAGARVYCTAERLAFLLSQYMHVCPRIHVDSTFTTPLNVIAGCWSDLTGVGLFDMFLLSPLARWIICSILSAARCQISSPHISAH